MKIGIQQDGRTVWFELTERQLQIFAQAVNALRARGEKFTIVVR